MNLYKISVISDIHIDKLDPIQAELELKDFLLKEIKEIKPNILFLAGDIWDSRLYLNSIYVSLINEFIYEIIKMDIVLIILNGTFSHDNNQLTSFTHYLDKKFYVFLEKGTFSHDGIHYLCLPEEYVNNKKEYYEKELYSGEKYDFIIGHGNLDFAGFVSHLSNVKTNQIVFTDEDFKNKAYGNVVFGHYHTHIKKDNVMYTGSMSRFKFNEEEPKGFFTFLYDKHKRITKKIIFHENKLAKTYNSINYDTIPDDKTVDFLINYKKKHDYLRIIVKKTQQSSKKYQDILLFMKNIKNCKLKIENDKQFPLNNEDKDNKKNIINNYKGKTFEQITIIEMSKKNVDIKQQDINNILN